MKVTITLPVGYFGETDVIHKSTGTKEYFVKKRIVIYNDE